MMWNLSDFLCVPCMKCIKSAYFWDDDVCVCVCESQTLPARFQDFTFGFYTEICCENNILVYSSLIQNLLFMKVISASIL